MTIWYSIKTKGVSKIKKYLPILTIIIVALIFVGVILKQRGITVSKNPVQQTVEKAVERAEEVFTGSLKEAAERGVPLKCTYKQEENEFEGVLKGKSWHGKMKSKDGQMAEVIIKDNCMWSWNPTDKTNQGAKICFEDKNATAGGENQDIWEKSDVDNPDIKYTCLPANVSDSEFEPPKEIQFIDLNQINY